MIYFLDTSALVKRYHLELGTPQVKALFDTADTTLFISELALVEFASAFQRRKSRNEVTAEALNHAIEKFESDAQNRLLLIDVNRILIEKAKSLALSSTLRALDALQLATALSIKSQSPIFVSADEKLVQAAQANGLSILNPVSSS